MNEHDRLTELHIFIQWLAHKDALDNWLTEVVDFVDRSANGNTKSSIKRLGSMTDNMLSNPESVIGWSLSYDGTAQGFDYWQDLSQQWGRIHYRLRKNLDREV